MRRATARDWGKKPVMYQSDEDHKERLDRELIELLNELRVALPGVQVLFAFLLTVPFTSRFEAIKGSDRQVYYAAVVATALASAFLIAPSAHHRLRFRDATKESMIKTANRLAVAGFGLLALGMASVLYLITNVLYDQALGAAVAAAFVAVAVFLWFVLPRLFPPDGRGHTGDDG